LFIVVSLPKVHLLRKIKLSQYKVNHKNVGEAKQIQPEHDIQALCPI